MNSLPVVAVALINSDIDFNTVRYLAKTEDHLVYRFLVLPGQKVKVGDKVVIRVTNESLVYKVGYVIAVNINHPNIQLSPLVDVINDRQFKIYDQNTLKAQFQLHPNDQQINDWGKRLLV